MAKVYVTANEDFFDRGNSAIRKKGQLFQLKEEHVKGLPVTVSKEAGHPVAKKAAKADKKK